MFDMYLQTKAWCHVQHREYIIFLSNLGPKWQTQVRNISSLPNNKPISLWTMDVRCCSPISNRRGVYIHRPRQQCGCAKLHNSHTTYQSFLWPWEITSNKPIKSKVVYCETKRYIFITLQQTIIDKPSNQAKCFDQHWKCSSQHQHPSKLHSQPTKCKFKMTVNQKRTPNKRVYEEPAYTMGEPSRYPLNEETGRLCYGNHKWILAKQQIKTKYYPTLRLKMHCWSWIVETKHSTFYSNMHTIKLKTDQAS